MAFVLVDVENCNGFGPFETKQDAAIAAPQLGLGTSIPHWQLTLDYDPKVIDKWEEGEQISYFYRGGPAPDAMDVDSMFIFTRVDYKALMGKAEAKLIEWAEVSTRCQDFLVYCLNVGVIAPAVFGQRDRLDVHDEVLMQFAEDYVTQAQEVED